MVGIGGPTLWCPSTGPLMWGDETDLLSTSESRISILGILFLSSKIAIRACRINVGILVFWPTALTIVQKTECHRGWQPHQAGGHRYIAVRLYGNLYTDNLDTSDYLNTLCPTKLRRTVGSLTFTQHYGIILRSCSRVWARPLDRDLL